VSSSSRSTADGRGALSEPPRNKSRLSASILTTRAGSQPAGLRVRDADRRAKHWRAQRLPGVRRRLARLCVRAARPRAWRRSRPARRAAARRRASDRSARSRSRPGRRTNCRPAAPADPRTRRWRDRAAHGRDRPGPRRTASGRCPTGRNEVHGPGARAPRCPCRTCGCRGRQRATARWDGLRLEHFCKARASQRIVHRHTPAVAAVRQRTGPDDARLTRPAVSVCGVLISSRNENFVSRDVVRRSRRGDRIGPAGARRMGGHVHDAA
jgi:hypothetical protein